MDSTDRNHDPRRCAHCQRNRESSTDLLAHPAWVKNAVFYQIFPDRFARSTRVRKPLNLEPWDAPPTHHGYKGGDLLGGRGPSRLAHRPRRRRDLLQPGLPFGFEPPLSHPRLLPGRSDPRRERRLRLAARSLSRPRHPGHPRRRVQPLESRLLPVPRRPRERRTVPVPRLVLHQGLAPEPLLPEPTRQLRVVVGDACPPPNSTPTIPKPATT